MQRRRQLEEAKDNIYRLQGIVGNQHHKHGTLSAVFYQFANDLTLFFGGVVSPFLDTINFTDEKRRDTFRKGRASRVNFSVLANSGRATRSLTDWCKQTREMAKHQKELENSMVRPTFSLG
jgi:hypothetical protein